MVGGLFAVSFGARAFLVLNDRVHAARQELERSSAMLADERFLVRNAEAIRGNADMVRRLLSDGESGRFHESNAGRAGAAASQYVAQLAGLSGVEILGPSSFAPSQNAATGALSADLAIRGPFANVVRFMNRLESGPVAFALKELLVVSPEPGEAAGDFVDATLVAETYWTRVDSR